MALLSVNNIEPAVTRVNGTDAVSVYANGEKIWPSGPPQLNNPIVESIYCQTDEDDDARLQGKFINTNPVPVQVYIANQYVHTLAANDHTYIYISEVPNTPYSYSFVTRYVASGYLDSQTTSSGRVTFCQY